MSNNQQRNSKNFLTKFSIKQQSFFPFRGSNRRFLAANAAFSPAERRHFTAFIRILQSPKCRAIACEVSACAESPAGLPSPPTSAENDAKKHRGSLSHRQRRRVADARLERHTHRGRRVVQRQALSEKTSMSVLFVRDCLATR